MCLGLGVACYSGSVSCVGKAPGRVCEIFVLCIVSVPFLNVFPIKKNNIDHLISCKLGGFVCFRHNNVRDLIGHELSI